MRLLTAAAACCWLLWIAPASSGSTKSTKGILVGESAILAGHHPQLIYSYAGKFEDEVLLRYEPTEGEVFEYDDAPRYFWGLADEEIEYEVELRTKNGRWSDRVLLGKFYFNILYGLTGLPDDYDQAAKEPNKLETVRGWDIFNRESNYCNWKGLTCNQQGKLIEIRLESYALSGILSRDLGVFTDLEYIELKGNMIKGTIPPSWGQFTNLKTLSLGVNRLTGTIPKELASLTSLEQIWLTTNEFRGTITGSLFKNWKNLQLLDLSNNKLSGSLPENLGTSLTKLTELFLENNQFTGPLPEDPSGLKSLQVIDVGSNQFSGTIPTHWMSLPQLRDFDVVGNYMSGTIPTEILWLSNLEIFVLSHNSFTGTIPRGDDIIPSVGRIRDDAPTGGQWMDLAKLELFMVNHNKLTGILPPELMYGVSLTLTRMDIGNNRLTGSIPPHIGRMFSLQRFDAMGNRFTGTLPAEMNRIDPNLELNLTNNLLVGSVPKMFCGGGQMSANLLYRQFGCDAVLCPAGTFHPHGAATLQSGCRPCPATWDSESQYPPLSKILGRTECPSVEFVHGDLNGDGKLSPREVLRLLYVDTIGRNWGAQFQTWADLRVNECDINGITCLNGEVAKVDLTDAALCSNGERKVGPTHECLGIPMELSLLTALEVVTLNRRQWLRGTIPSELGRLTKLKYLDISSCPSITGTLPSELGRLTDLRYLNLGGCRLSGTIPPEIFNMAGLEKLHLSMNVFTGTIPTEIGKLELLKELMFSRTHITGPIPKELGNLSGIENLEMYGNQLTGNIPASLGTCTALKRMDIFNNKLSGTIPVEISNLESLQIFHAKLNRLTGTISPKFGELPYLSWFDVSANSLRGTIPSTFGSSRSIKDFRLGGNMIYEPIPPSLCVNTNINGGLTRMYGCDGVICPLGTFSDPGHATHSEGCKPCPDGTTNMYLGSSSCEVFSQEDLLSILFDAMGGSNWNVNQQRGWKDKHTHVCEWNGINCNEEMTQIESIRLPLLGVDE